MKKILLMFVSLLFLTGCGMTEDKPTMKVEEMLNKYKMKDSVILTQLENLVSQDDSLEDKQKEEYREVIARQYQDLKYEILNEKVNDDNATVETEIEVYDYAKVIKEAEKYVKEHDDEFTKEDSDGKKIADDAKINDYKIKKMKEQKDRKKYKVDFTLTKEDDKWKVDDLTTTQRRQIHGLYDE